MSSASIEDQTALIVGHWKIGKTDRLFAFGITGRRAWVGLSEQYLEFVVEASSRELDDNREGERHFPAGCELYLRPAREVLDDKWDSAASVAEPPDTVAKLDTAEVPMEERGPIKTVGPGKIADDIPAVSVPEVGP